jgi:hypothetical protein
MNFADYFEGQIEVQQRAIRSYRVWVTILIVVGLGIIVYSFISSVKEMSSDLIKTGGGIFTAALAALPYKEITPRRERIVAFSLLKTEFRKDEELPPEILELAMETIRENLKR